MDFDAGEMLAVGSDDTLTSISFGCFLERVVSCTNAQKGCYRYTQKHAAFSAVADIVQTPKCIWKDNVLGVPLGHVNLHRYCRVFSAGAAFLHGYCCEYLRA